MRSGYALKKLKANHKNAIHVFAMNEQAQAQAKTLDQLLKDTVPRFISPTPCRETLQRWLSAAKVPRFKANPKAKRGGGPVYYQVSAVEKLFLRNLKA